MSKSRQKPMQLPTMIECPECQIGESKLSTLPDAEGDEKLVWCFNSGTKGEAKEGNLLQTERQEG